MGMTFFVVVVDGFEYLSKTSWGKWCLSDGVFNAATFKTQQLAESQARSLKLKNPTVKKICEAL